MQKYLLLLLMCLVGMIEAQAGIKVENVGTGSYILTFTNSADATYDWDNLRDDVLSATTVKIVTEGEYKLTKDDMGHIMGAKDDPNYANRSTVFTNLKTLDMADANLNNSNDMIFMSCAKSGNGLTNLTSFTFPKTISSFPIATFKENTTIKEIIMLDGSLTEIPTDAFKGCTKLSDVMLPYGVTKIGSGAFQNCAFENISLPTSLVEIGPNAFESCKKLKSITIPMSVKKIGDSAFQKNTSMTDVYVLGNEVEIQDGAFNEGQTYNFNYQQNGDVDYTDWKPTNGDGSGTAHALILHVPNNDTALMNYVNPYLMMLNDPEMEDLFDKANAAYSDQDIKDQFNTLFKKYGIQPPSWGSYDNGMNYGLFKRENWVTMKSVDGKIKKFFKTADKLFGETPEVDNSVYGGWRNFMLVQADVEEKIWYDGRLVESRWYSAVFPFDMSYNQVMSAYGAKTDVREFSYVNKKVTDGQETRTVTFSKRVTIPNGDKNNPKYVQKGVPYMIHPGVRSIPLQARGTAVQASQERTIAGVDVKAANDVVNTEATLVVTGDLVDGNKPLRGSGYETITPQAYTFRGSYKDGDIPANSFYLGYDPDDPIKWPLAFYVTKKTLVGKWTAFTSIVQKVNADATSQAKTMSLGFSDDFVEDFGIATEIERVYMEKRSESNSVYNLNGQVVRENNTSVQGLSKGVYVVNGKKIVVR